MVSFRWRRSLYTPKILTVITLVSVIWLEAYRDTGIL